MFLHQIERALSNERKAAENGKSGQLRRQVCRQTAGTAGKGRPDSGTTRGTKRDSNADAAQLGILYKLSARKSTAETGKSARAFRPHNSTSKINFPEFFRNLSESFKYLPKLAFIPKVYPKFADIVVDNCQIWQYN